MDYPVNLPINLQRELWEERMRADYNYQNNSYILTRINSALEVGTIDKEFAESLYVRPLFAEEWIKDNL